MIEVDVFWSFAFGAGFAAAAQGPLSREKSCWVNKYSVYNLFFLSCIFAPSGIYLLWQFPGWESMYVLGDKNTIPAILPTIFSMTNTLLGMIGFYVTYQSIQNNKNNPNANHHVYWVHAFTIFNAILGLGFRRFTYSGNHVDWANGVYYPPYMFVTSEVFMTLLAMGVILIPACVIPAILYSRETFAINGNGIANGRWVSQILSQAFYGYALIAAGYLTLVLGVYSPERRDSFVFGWWAPLAGFTTAQILVYSIILTPFVLAQVVGFYDFTKEAQGKVNGKVGKPVVNGEYASNGKSVKTQ